MPLSDFIARRRTVLPLAAMAIGVLAVLVGVTRERPSLVPAQGEIARVNGHAIDTDSFARTYASFTQGLKRPVQDSDRTLILNRLIDQEVLVQRAVALGLPNQDPAVRKQLVQAMIALTLAQAAAPDPPDDELKRYIDANADLFRIANKIKIDALFVRNGDETRRSAVAAALRRSDWPAAKKAGEALPVPVPDDFLPPAKIADYIGADAASAVAALTAGQASDFITVSGGLLAVKLVSAQADAPAPFETLRETALTRWRQERDAKALRAAIDELRAQADIVMPK